MDYGKNYYYNKMLDLFQENLTEKICLENVVHQFSLYYLCNHYYGDEVNKYNIPIPNNINNLLLNNNFKDIKDLILINNINGK